MQGETGQELPEQLEPGGARTELSTLPLVGFINDVTCRVRQDKNFLNNSSLVVRVNEKYTSFSMAAPILMSVLMFKVSKYLIFHRLSLIVFRIRIPILLSSSKNSKKNLGHFCYVTSKSNKQKIILCCLLKVTDENSRMRSRIRIH